MNHVAQAFSNAAEQYDALARQQAELGETFVTSLGDSFFAGKTVLDIGCGPARLHRQVGQSAHIISIDAAAGMCEQARQYGATIVQADAEGLPFKPEAFDMVYSAFTWQWVSNPRAVLASIHALLKPAGALAIVTYGEGTLRSLSPPFSRLSFATLDQQVADIGAAGFDLEHADKTIHTIAHESPKAVLDYVKQIGAGSVPHAPVKPSLAKAWLADTANALSEWHVHTFIARKR